MKNSHVIVFLVCTLTTVSCKKDKLEDSKEVLIGRWNWVYSQHAYGWCQYDVYYETVSPVEQGKNYELEFIKNGKLKYYENGKVIETSRIVFNYFEQASDKEYYFYFYLDNDLEKGMAGSIHGDTLHFDYPLVEEDPNCENYLNFFVRE